MLFTSMVEEGAEQRDLDVITPFPEGNPSFQSFTPCLREGEGLGGTLGWDSACHFHAVC